MFHPLLKALAEYGKDVLGISWIWKRCLGHCKKYDHSQCCTKCTFVSGSDLLVAWIDFIFCGQNYCFISLGCLKFSKKRYTKYETLILLSNLLDRELVLCRKTLYSEIVSFQNLNATNFFQVLLNQRCQMALREDLWPYWVYSYRSQMPKRLAISVTRLIFINLLLFWDMLHM